VASADDAASVLAEFRLSMRRIASTVHVITTAQGGERYGMTATAVCSLSFDPLTLLICVNRDATLHGPLRAGGRFCVNVLAEGQAEIASQFGSRRLEALRFTSGGWFDLGGAPALADAQSNILCCTRFLADVGTHALFVGEVLRAETRDLPPLVYRDGGYRACS